MTLRIGDHVQAALAAGSAVVALESTIITHGLPRPHNVEVARQAEDVVRAAGAVPATVGVLDGQAVVGLTPPEVERLGSDDAAVKCSIRDLATTVVRGQSGGTTVAATAYLAHQAGITVFPTGGLGGVHRGAASTFDESADLVALSQLPVVMVSAGVKSILDTGATLERLETLSVTVLGYQTDAFPGFYIADSGFPVPARADDPTEIAAIARARDTLGISSAVLVTRPVPTEHQLDPALHDRVLAEALAAAEQQGVHGHDVTPFLLDYFHTATQGASEDTNVQIYLGNVGLGAEIAKALTA